MSFDNNARNTKNILTSSGTTVEHQVQFFFRIVVVVVVYNSIALRSSQRKRLIGVDHPSYDKPLRVHGDVGLDKPNDGPLRFYDVPEVAAPLFFPAFRLRLVIGVHPMCSCCLLLFVSFSYVLRVGSF